MNSGPALCPSLITNSAVPAASPSCWVVEETHRSEVGTRTQEVEDVLAGTLLSLPLWSACLEADHWLRVGGYWWFHQGCSESLKVVKC